MFNPIKIHRSVMGQSCEYGSCEIGTQHGSNMPAAVAFNTTPSNGFTNHYICHNHMVALIETIFDDPEYGPIARKMGRDKLIEYADVDQKAESDLAALIEEEARATAAPPEKKTYPCYKCGKLLKNPAARSIHEQHCHVVVGAPITEESGIFFKTGDRQSPADFKEAYGDKYRNVGMAGEGDVFGNKVEHVPDADAEGPGY